jgi:hypothetical protein
LREDPNKPGLLFAGTERGVYVSFNDGDSWQKLNLNLPLTPIRDLKFKKRKGFNCCYAWTCFWVLDDITPLYEIKDKTIKVTNTFSNRVLLIECKADKAMT